MTSPSQSNLDIPEIHTPALATNVGEKILSQPGARDLVGAANELVDRGKRAMRRLPRNVGDTDQKIRVIAGLGALAAAPFLPIRGRWKLAVAIAGGSLATSGSARYCPLWHATGVNTNRS